MSPDPSGLLFADPTNPQSVNLYSYALNNPLSYDDPSGLAYCQWSLTAGGVEDRDDTYTGDPDEDQGAARQSDCSNGGGTWITEPGDPEGIGNGSGDTIIPMPETTVEVDGGDDSQPSAVEAGAQQLINFQSYSTFPFSYGCAAEPMHIPLRVSSPYGPRVFRGKPDFHTGVDYAAPVGTPVYSAETGRVALAYSSASAGNVIVVQNPFGGDSIYMHLSGFAVPKGQGVGAGDRIGSSGNTGHSTGPHLHFEQHTPGPITANGVFNHSTLTAPCR